MTTLPTPERRISDNYTAINVIGLSASIADQVGLAIATIKSKLDRFDPTGITFGDLA